MLKSFFYRKRSTFERFVVLEILKDIRLSSNMNELSKIGRRKGMFSKTALPPVLEFHQLTPERWKDLEVLFGERGACGGCWCMWWRLKRSQFEKQKDQENRKTFRKIVDSGEIPGLLAYANG